MEVKSMRYKRKTYFKKLRRRKTAKMLLITIVMPSGSVFLGYIVASLIILPSMGR